MNFSNKNSIILNLAQDGNSCQEPENIFSDNSQLLDAKHYQELKNSAISDSLIENNFQSIYGEESYELLLSDAIAQLSDGKLVPHSDQYVTSDIKKYYRQYQHTLAGGWWCSGVDPLNNFLPMVWGCFKPDQPRVHYEKKDTIKYEHPYKTATRAFFLIPGRREWELIANRYGVPIGEYDNFWLWAKDHKIPIIITEGAKKAAALLSAGYVAIGIPGIFNGHRKDKDWNKKRFLIPDLIPFADGRQFYICFDNDTKISAKKNTEIAISQLGSLLRKAKSHVLVITWTYPEKGIDDLIVAHGNEVLDTVISAAVTLSELEVRKHYALSNISEKITRRYLGDIFKDKEGYRVLGVRSPKGTGKTESLITYVAEMVGRGYKVYLASHRIQLCQEICSRLNLPYVDDRGSKSGGYGFVLDSFHRFGKCSETINDTYSFLNNDEYMPYVVIIDEIEQVLWHLLTSTTDIKSHRCEVISLFEQLLKNSNQVVALDADLTDVSITYLKSVIGCRLEDIHIINNDYKEGGYEFFLYNKVEELMEVASMLAGSSRTEPSGIKSIGKSFIATDSQKFEGKYSTKNLEIFFQKHNPDLKILRIDSESISDPQNAACGVVSHLNNVIQNYDIVIASPSIGTGVSIDIRGHFENVFGFFQGVQGENSVRQMLMRVRDNVDRHIFISEHGLQSHGDGGFNNKLLFSDSKKLFNTHIKTLCSTGFEISEDGININSSALNCYLKMAARINFEMRNYRDIILDNLKKEGNIFKGISSGLSGDIKEKMEVNKEINSTNNRLAIAWSDISKMTKDDYKKLQKQKLKTTTERHKQRKYQIYDLYKLDDDFWESYSKLLGIGEDRKNKLHNVWELNPDLRKQGGDFRLIEKVQEDGTILKTYNILGTINWRDYFLQELIDYDDQGLYPKWKLHYHLTTGRKFAALSDARAADRVKQDKTAYLPDFNRSQLETKVRVLELLNIPDILTLETITANHPLLIRLQDIIKNHSKEIRLLIGAFHPDMTPIQMLRKILKLIGGKLERCGREGSGDRNWIYKVELEGFIQFRELVFGQWEKYDTLKYLGVDENGINMIQSTSQFSIYKDRENWDGTNNQEILDGTNNQEILDGTNNQGGECLFLDLTTNEWLEGVVEKVETLFNGTFKAMVRFGEGLVRVLWSREHLIIAGEV